MNIYEFFNSQDVAEHLRKIKYKFSPLEMAYVISQSNKPLAIKHAAWQEIVDTMPDCKVMHGYCLNQQTSYNIDCESLHYLLKDYMGLQREQLERFYKQDNGAWLFDWKASDTQFSCDYIAYNSPQECFAALEQSIAGVDGDFDYIHMRRKSTKSSHDRDVDIVVSCDANAQVLDIVQYEEFYTEFWQELIEVFDGMWFSFPLPFKRGDIVAVKGVNDNLHNVPFVLSDIACWTSHDLLRNNIPDTLYKLSNRTTTYYKWRNANVRRLKKSGETRDMWAQGYFVCNDGKVFSRMLTSYLNMEFYRVKFAEKQEFVDALSNFVKGTIDKERLLQAYHKTTNNNL